MTNKQYYSRMIFGLVMLFTCIVMAMFQLPACKSHPKGGTCTYEGLECPNALLQFQDDSLAMADMENTIDSLQTVLFACELRDHSKIK